MNEEQIVVQARRVVAERRELHEARRSRRWALILPGLAAALIIGFLLYPLPMAQKLLLAMGGVCGLRPSHSYVAGAIQLPLESRMMGIYGGFMLTLGWLLVTRRFGARHLGSRITLVLLGLMFLSMVFDGVNSTLTEFDMPHLYTSTNLTRITTGLLSGIAIATLLTWLIGAQVRPRTQGMARSLIASPAELLWPLALCLLFGRLVVQEWAWMYYPAALLSVGGMTLALAGSLLLPILHFGRLRHRVATPGQLLVPSTLALLLAFAVLAGTAAMRWSTVGPLN